MPLLNEIAGSSVRDFCMLERNYLSYFKLILLLFLLSCSALLDTRLPAPGSKPGSKERPNLPISILQFLAAVLTMAAAVWEYHRGVKDLLRVRAFLVGTKVHYSLMTVVSALVIATSIMYIVSGSR